MISTISLNIKELTIVILLESLRFKSLEFELTIYIYIYIYICMYIYIYI